MYIEKCINFKYAMQDSFIKWHIHVTTTQMKK